MGRTPDMGDQRLVNTQDVDPTHSHAWSSSLEVRNADETGTSDVFDCGERRRFPTSRGHFSSGIVCPHFFERHRTREEKRKKTAVRTIYNLNQPMAVV